MILMVITTTIITMEILFGLKVKILFIICYTDGSFITQIIRNINGDSLETKAEEFL